jgi:hypothetical protein
MESLDAIVALLQKYHQRATYGAVAEPIGRAPRSLMQGRRRSWLNSWVVNQDSGLLSEYATPMMDPHLRERAEILSTADALRTWLDNPR